MNIKERQHIPKAIKKWDAMILAHSEIDRSLFKSDQDYINYLNNRLDILIENLSKATDLVEDLFTGKL